MTERTALAGPTLVGSCSFCSGALLYLLEWVAIIAAKVDAPLGAGASTRTWPAAYDRRRAAREAWAAGWFSVVLGNDKRRSRSGPRYRHESGRGSIR